MKRAIYVLSFGIIMILAIYINTLTVAGDPASDLITAINNKDNKLLKKATEQLVSQNDEKAFMALSGALGLLGQPPEEEAYMTLLVGIARLTNKDVIPKITNLILKDKDKNLGRDLLGIMKSNHSPIIIPLLSSVLEKGTYDMQMECLHQLGSIYAKESLEAIINFLRPIKPNDKDKKEIIKEALSSLETLTGINKGNYHDIWVLWWDENKTKDAKDLIHPTGIDADKLENIKQYRNMKGIQTLEADKVIVVRNDEIDEYIKKAGGSGFDGNFDHIQDILARLGIPYTLVGKSELEKDSFNWDSKWAIIFNCNFFKERCVNPEHFRLKPTGQQGSTERTEVCPGQSNHIAQSSKLSEKVIKKIKEFVETGGYLFTEDLNIEEIIERAFKGYITHTKFLPERTVKIMPAPGAVLNPYLKYVFESPPTLKTEGPISETKSVKASEFRIDTEWKIDNQSPDIKILNNEKVTLLISSPELAKAQKENNGAVAVTFSVSDKDIVITKDDKGPNYAPGGRVLHVMSHFGKQRSKLDEFALQNLIFNFLMECNERRPRVSQTPKK
jgi:hypothetical protein